VPLPGKAESIQGVYLAIPSAEVPSQQGGFFFEVRPLFISLPPLRFEGPESRKVDDKERN
jgi:hypothetical protein